MSTEDHKALLQEYFKNVTTMQLATVAGGKPWVCTVYFFESDGLIYWTSLKSRRHSVEILSNPLVAGTIVLDNDKKRALQFEGEAFILPLDDAERVNKLYGDRFGFKQSRLDEVLEDKEDSRAFWVLKPTFMSFWDEVAFPESPKVEIEL